MEELPAFQLHFFQEHLLGGGQELSLAFVQLLEDFGHALTRERENGFDLPGGFADQRSDLFLLFSLAVTEGIGLPNGGRFVVVKVVA